MDFYALKHLPGILIFPLIFIMLSFSSKGQLAAPYNMQVWVEYDALIRINASWDCDPDTGFQFYLVKRDGLTVGTSTSNGYCYTTTDLSGTVCITASAYYDHGQSEEITACATWGSSHIAIEPNFHKACLKSGDSLVHYVNIANNGNTELSFSFPGFDSGSPPPGFIKSVVPSSGVISPDGMAYIEISWDASGYNFPGDEQDLILNSSDAALPVSIISNEMIVMDMVYIAGHVYDSLTLQPINGAEIGLPYYYTLMNRPVKSLSDGSYVYKAILRNNSLYLPCKKQAYYDRRYILDTAALNAADTILLDFYLSALPYPVNWVDAGVLSCSIPSAAYINWSLPSGEEEIIYDDGIAEDYFSWNSANNESAVRITPAYYPAKLTGGSVYVGDGSYPGAYWLYREFAMLIYGEGTGGLPGNLLDSIGVLIYHAGWITFKGLDVQIDSGDIFISMKQINPFPYTAPLGIDNTMPLEGRSYQRSGVDPWSLSAYQDFMIRAIVDGPSNIGGMTNYTLSRISNFDPQAGPETGTHTTLGNLTGVSYVDTLLPELPEAWYAYAVQVSYSNGNTSANTYSNIVGNSMGNTVTFILSDCLLGPTEGFVVTANGQDWPFGSQVDTSDANGLCVFECMTTGGWEYRITKCGYEDHEFASYIDQDMTFEIIMNNKLYMPRNLNVDSVTGMASWQEPMVTALLDGFDEMNIYLNGWQMLSNGNGWIQTDDGGSAGFFIPSTGSTYMCVNDHAGGAGNNGCCDMLITPELDLCESDDYILGFDSYFTGVLGQTATVEYSVDNGQSWTVLYTLDPAAGVWEYIEIDLTAVCGVNAYESINFSFHADDGGGVASGWAIDNVDIRAGNANASSYYVYLDGLFMSTADTTNFQYSGLSYGQTYVASTAALYDCGLSEATAEIFTSGYLAPPTYLEADSSGQDAELLWVFDTASILGVMPDVFGFYVYRDSVEIAFVPYTGQDTTCYTDEALDPMCYDYHVSTVYDVSSYGLASDTAQSLYTGPEEVCIYYGENMPVFEDWGSGSFGSFWDPGDNWVINGQHGNDPPCAEFTWDPIMQDYSSGLISSAINGISGNAKNDPYIDGQFILKFDVFLDNVNATGNEFLKVEVWSEGEWNLVFQFSNSNGNIDWETTEVDITRFALGHIFKIRFMAEGQVSSDILSWYIDNISLERVCYPPYDMMIVPVAEDAIYVNWRPPDTGSLVSDTWIRWDNGTSNGGIGLTGGGTFSVASHWDADMLIPYNGYSITKMQFVPGELVSATDYTLKIWEGPDAGELLYEEPVNNLVYGQWNEIVLSIPVMIDINKELWFGYTCSSSDGDFPAGHDEGPAVAGYGDMITLDGVVWDPISSFGAQFNINWNLKALVSQGNDAGSIPIDKISDMDLPERQLNGYDIYWNENAGVGAYEYLGFTQDTFFVHHKDPPFIFGELYTYKVIAVYEDCEAEAIETIIWEGLNEVTREPEINIYPNPTSNSLQIVSNQMMSGLALFDYSGRALNTTETPGRLNIVLDVSSYEPGLYLIRINVSEGQVVKKLIIK